MQTKDFYYELPKNLIAQTPMEKRDNSRLMVLNRETKEISDKIFYNIVDYINEGDGLVVNNTKVIAARLFGRKNAGQAMIEVFLLKRLSLDLWEVLLKPGKKLHIGDKVVFREDVFAELIGKNEDGTAKVKFYYEGVFENILDELGQTPLPPYITQQLSDKSRYQTVYAKVEGSCAAPTAGFHFTNELLDKLKDKGVVILPVLLHVGLGTFRPVKEKNIKDHKMHEEYYCVSEDTARKYNDIKNLGKKIFAVGTTSVRTLETVADENGMLKEAQGNTGIFIYPGYKFKTVDHIITNFHIPESTLLMLVSAFAGKDFILKAYDEAVKKEYRFFSFGDAMLIL